MLYTIIKNLLGRNLIFIIDKTKVWDQWFTVCLWIYLQCSFGNFETSLMFWFYIKNNFSCRNIHKAISNFPQNFFFLNFENMRQILFIFFYKQLEIKLKKKQKKTFFFILEFFFGCVIGSI